jgi:tellurite resistance protein TerC
MTMTLALSADHRVWAYPAFIAIICCLLALDLGVFHRRAREVHMREAMGWTAAWVSLSLLFNLAVYFLYEHHWLGLGLDVPVLGKPGQTETLGGLHAAQLYFTGYVIEFSLSMDNVFVIAVIFSSLGIPRKYQHRVLFWGIVGAILMRGAMIFAGVALIERFSWIVYVFGGVLIVTALKMALTSTEKVDPSASRVVRLTRRLFPVTDRFDGQRFFTRVDGRRMGTPLLVTLVLIEVTDLIFAVDSIPAIFALTADRAIVFTSNIFAVLGLRALYFCVAAMLGKFRYLKPSLVVVLLFIGCKMLLVHTPWKIETGTSLLVVVGVLGIGVAASLVASRRERSRSRRDLPADASPSEQGE